MAASIFIIIVSAVLFGYWFRYTCSLFLQTSPPTDYSTEVAAENRLSFPRVQQELEESGSPDIVALYDSLQRDYRVVAALLKQVGEFSMAGTSVEEFLLRADFWLMKARYNSSLRVSETTARAALTEMCQIVERLSNSFAERLVALPVATQD